MNIKERIKQKTEQLEKIGKEIGQLQGILREKQVEAIKLAGAITQLQEKESEETMNIQPYGNRIMVKKAKTKEEITPDGVVIPETAAQAPMTAEVIAVGEGKQLENGLYEPISIAVGTTILMGRYAGVEIQLDREPFWIISPDEILGIVFEDLVVADEGGDE